MRGEPLLIRAAEAGALAGVHPRKIYAWAAAGLIPEQVLFRAGRAIYLRRGLFVAWLNGQDGRPQADAGAREGAS